MGIECFHGRKGISIHALRVEGDPEKAWEKIVLEEISIHALRVEGDVKRVVSAVRAFLFLSTPSVWRATTAGLRSLMDLWISIHALRVEGDRERV